MSLAAEHYGAADFRRDTDVPRETAERLAAYADLLVRWQRRINLVGPATLADLWRRHMLDSAQFLDHAPGRGGTWVDLGSGAGFPGLVLAILGAGDVHLVESDGRKCAFLAEAARVTATPVRIHRVRAEALAGVAADVVVSRAFAPLPRLLDLARPVAGPATVYLLAKGADVEAELTEAGRCWSMRAERFPSRTDERGTVLRLREVQPCP